MKKNEITPNDSACPVFLDPIDEAQLAADELEREAMENEKASRLAAKSSAIAKLSALGLTEAEMKAFMG